MLDESYNGWYLKRGELINPENNTISLNRLRYIEIAFSQLRDLKIEKNNYVQILFL